MLVDFAFGFQSLENAAEWGRDGSPSRPPMERPDVRVRRDGDIAALPVAMSGGARAH
ncbi:hypothetical protein P4C99_16380 [Pontiellaceae bacterium B1224]|nr:hypothetical protein [Pontiellaceae bacterium B1224]